MVNQIAPYACSNLIPVEFDWLGEDGVDRVGSRVDLAPCCDVALDHVPLDKLVNLTPKHVAFGSRPCRRNINEISLCIL